ncbi:MAG: MFS transporter [Candidatus Thorarchaeota archaeon]|nr:MFS transporter [Candidatus Thorarchaeota archaeon]
MESPIIRKLFVCVFAFGFTLGALRFLFPFQIVNLGGTEALASLGGTYSAIGQVLGLMLIGRLFRSERRSLAIIGFSVTAFTLTMGLVQDSVLLATCRITEGIASAVLVLLIVRVSCQFATCRGESVGTLLAALFLGSAIGQGLVGLLVESAATSFMIAQKEAIQFLSLLLLVPPVLGMALAPSPTSGPHTKDTAHLNADHGHVHLSHIVHSLMSKRAVLLAVVYLLYDFSHGLYTPVLSLVVSGNGVPLELIGLSYLAGDIVWGLVQLYSGRLVDRLGHVLPLVVSLATKGVVVLLYPTATSLYGFVPLLAVAGAAEGFLEPSRNDAAMEYSTAKEVVHSHPHVYLSRTSGASLPLSRHEHEHTHKSAPDEAVSLLQILGIMGFGLGSAGGAWLLVTQAPLTFLILLGGWVLLATSMISAALYRRRPSPEM